MGFTEYALLALVILVPLAVAVAVTLWSLKQVQYRPKKRRPDRAATTDQRETGAGAGAAAAGPSEPASS